MEKVRSESEKARKPGRPRAIPEALESVVVRLYRQGHGYRAIARILRNGYEINPHFSSVRKTLHKLSVIKPGDPTA